MLSPIAKCLGDGIPFVMNRNPCFRTTRPHALAGFPDVNTLLIVPDFLGRERKPPVPQFPTNQFPDQKRYDPEQHQ